jgi:hypothetical protein
MTPPVVRISLTIFAALAALLPTGASPAFSAEPPNAKHEKVRIQKVNSIRQVVFYNGMTAAVSNALAHLPEISVSDRPNSNAAQLLQGDTLLLTLHVNPLSILLDLDPRDGVNFPNYKIASR